MLPQEHAQTRASHLPYLDPIFYVHKCQRRVRCKAHKGSRRPGVVGHRSGGMQPNRTRLKPLPGLGTKHNQTTHPRVLSPAYPWSIPRQPQVDAAKQRALSAVKCLTSQNRRSPVAPPTIRWYHCCVAVRCANIPGVSGPTAFSFGYFPFLRAQHLSLCLPLTRRSTLEIFRARAAVTRR